MGSRTKQASTRGAFGGRCFVQSPEGDCVTFLRPNRFRDRSKHRRVSARGRRSMTFGDVLRHNLAVKKKADESAKPTLLQKASGVFQRKAK